MSIPIGHFWGADSILTRFYSSILQKRRSCDVPGLVLVLSPMSAVLLHFPGFSLFALHTESGSSFCRCEAGLGVRALGVVRHQLRLTPRCGVLVDDALGHHAIEFPTSRLNVLLLVLGVVGDCQTGSLYERAQAGSVCIVPSLPFERLPVTFFSLSMLRQI